MDSHHAHHMCFLGYVPLRVRQAPPCGFSMCFSPHLQPEVSAGGSAQCWSALAECSTHRRCVRPCCSAASCFLLFVFSFRAHLFAEVTQEHANACHAIISVGGDGTFLKVASMIRRTQVLLAGVNSDPHNSAGSLCALPHDKAAIHAFLEKALSGTHAPVVRSRLQSTIREFGASPTSSSDVETPLALNEVFIASNDPAAVSSFAVSIDGEPEFLCKNSGILMSTGTGSTGW